MKTLIVTAHPDSDSLTHDIARRLEQALKPRPVEFADLAAEGFDPRFTFADLHTYRVGGDFAPDVAAEQLSIDKAAHLVLVFPVYWWSMPALLKGWIGRVFVNGWAFEMAAEGGMRRKLGDVTTHLVPIATMMLACTTGTVRASAADTDGARHHRLLRQPARRYGVRV